MRTTVIGEETLAHRLPIAEYCEFVNTMLPNAIARRLDAEQAKIEVQKLRGAIQFLDQLDAVPHTPKEISVKGWPANSDHPRFFKALGLSFFLDHPYALEPLSSEYRVENLPNRFNLYSPNTHCRLVAKTGTEMKDFVFDTVLQRLFSSDIDVWSNQMELPL